MSECPHGFKLVFYLQNNPSAPFQFAGPAGVNWGWQVELREVEVCATCGAVTGGQSTVTEFCEYD